MKISFPSTAAYIIAAFVMIQRIAAHLPIADSSTSSLVHEPKSCEARLDRIERKVEFQIQEMAHLRQDHEELKAIVINRKQKIPLNQDDSNEEKIKTKLINSKDVSFKNDLNDRIRIKKPARLLPLSLFRGHKNNTDEVFNDPPTNCRDLTQIGHTLNGYYPVQLKLEGMQKPSKIGMIYCNFNPDPKTPPANVERKLGYLDIKSCTVKFYVQRNSDFNQSNAVIRPYQIDALNQGGAMNVTSGVFRAPVNGTYYFSFRGFAHVPLFKGNHGLSVNLYRNNNIAATSTSTVAGGVTVSLECMLKLRKGDYITVKTSKLAVGSLQDTRTERLTHFSGALIEEDLNF